MIYVGHILAQVEVSNLPTHLQEPKASTNYLRPAPNHSQEPLNQPEAASIIPNPLKVAPAIHYHLQPPKTLPFYLTNKNADLSQYYLYYL